MENIKIDYSKVGPNIRALREAFGETLETLAGAVGRDAVSNFSSFENGTRIPPRDVLVRIAQHYRVTEDELIHSDFTKLRKMADLPLNDKKYNEASFEKLLPLVHSDKAFENENFKKAYLLHINLYQYILEGKDFCTDQVDRCMDLYDAAGREGIIEGRANKVWWIMLLGILTVLITPMLAENIKQIKAEGAKLKDILKFGFLPNFGSDAAEEYFQENEKRRIEFLEEYEVDLLVNLNLLRREKQYLDLADYYLALRYEFNLLSNSLSAEMNKAVGDQMMRTFSLMGNKFAEAFHEPVQLE